MSMFFFLKNLKRVGAHDIFKFETLLQFTVRFYKLEEL